jgi:hypothetical protein
MKAGRSSDYISIGIVHPSLLIMSFLEGNMERDASTSGPGSQDFDEVHSAVSWAAILAGAAATVALSFVLLTLAAGFGFILASPWPGAKPSLSTFTPLLGAGMVAVQVLSCALGGYLAGRLRTKWLNVHSHEVFFRDTAHGLLVWAVSTLLGFLLSMVALAIPVEQGGLLAATARDTNIAAQFSFFLAFGLLLSAFVASVAGALGGLRRDEMHAKYRAVQPV